jgi:hypothetical protein
MDRTEWPTDRTEWPKSRTTELLKIYGNADDRL